MFYMVVLLLKHRLYNKIRMKSLIISRFSVVAVLGSVGGLLRLGVAQLLGLYSITDLLSTSMNGTF